MKAVVLAAGKGTRMRELTRDRPKPMLEVQGRPILEHLVERLARSGVSDLCVVTGYLAEQIEDHFQSGAPWGMRIRYVRQTNQGGTGKAPELARDFVGTDNFLLTYGDILVPAAVYQQVQQRFTEGTFAGVLAVTPGEEVRQGGLNLFDQRFRLLRIVEKPSPAQVETLRQEGWLRPGEPVWYNAGVYLFRPVLFDYTARLQPSPRGEYELPDALNAMVGEGLEIAGCPIPRADWADVRDPEVLARLRNAPK